MAAGQGFGGPRQSAPPLDRETVQRQLTQARMQLLAGDLAAAERCYRQLLAVGVSSVELYGNLAVICGRTDRQAERRSWLEKALALQPDHMDLRFNYGNALMDLQQWPGAAAAYEAVLVARPEHPEAGFNLGLVRQRQGDLEGAVAAYRRDLERFPGRAGTHNNLGRALQDLGLLAETMEAYRRATELEPTRLAYWNNLGLAQQEAGETVAAVASFRAAVALVPEDALSRRNLALALLDQGAFTEGWQEYEWRLQSDPDLLQAPVAPRWQGNWAEQRELVLVAEQGFGDSLQFIRYARVLKQRLPRVSFLAQPELRDLMMASGLVDAVYGLEDLAGRTDICWEPLLSVPRYLGVTRDQPLETAPYLRVPEDRSRYWQERLRGDGPLIALSWQGNPEHERNASRGRSLPLEALAPLAALPGVRLLSLQKGFGAEQLETCPFRDRFVAAQAEVSASLDFGETAAQMQACDWVVTSDTAVAHLAGGLGLPTAVLLKAVPEWRWGRDGTRTAWYPSMRLFRQLRPGDWAAAVASLVQHLQSVL